MVHMHACWQNIHTFKIKEKSVIIGIITSQGRMEGPSILIPACVGGSGQNSNPGRLKGIYLVGKEERKLSYSHSLCLPL